MILPDHSSGVVPAQLERNVHVLKLHACMQIAEGLVYFQGLAATARPKVVALRDAVVAGDVEAAKTAYINSRNEYEQIEVLAPGFGDVDCSIDCRASAPHPCSPNPLEEFWISTFTRRFDY